MTGIGIRAKRFLIAPLFALCLMASNAKATCTSPAGNAGDILYSSTSTVMVYCNGSNWINMGSSGATSFTTPLTSGSFCTATSGTNIACTTAAINLATQVSGVLTGTNGGTGVNNGVNTITLGGNLTTSGAFATTGATSVTLPTSGTLLSTTSTIGTSQISGVIAPVNGGTGVANANTNTITLGSSFVTSGAFPLTLTTTASTNVTLPVSGTLVNTAVTTLSSLASIGTITTGVWNGTAIGPTYGGTGLSTYAKGDMLYGSAANVLSALPIGTTDYILTVSAGGVPSWAAAPASGVTSFSAGTTGLTPSGATTGAVTLAGTLNVANGGTGLATLTSNVIYKGNGTGALAVSGLTDNGTIISSSENIDAVGNAYLTEIANAGTTGTTVNTLAKLNASGAALIAATADTDGMVGIVTGGAGTSGNAQIAANGQASCVFDGATTAGHYVTISSTTAGDCSDSAARPTASQTIGRVLSTNASGGTYKVALALAPSGGTAGATTGTGAANYVARWTGTTALGTGAIFDNAVTVGIGTATVSASNKLEVNGAASVGYTNTAAPTNGLIVAGSTGIGTASPAYPLDIEQTSIGTIGTFNMTGNNLYVAPTGSSKSFSSALSNTATYTGANGSLGAGKNAQKIYGMNNTVNLSQNAGVDAGVVFGMSNNIYNNSAGNAQAIYANFNSMGLFGTTTTAYGVFATVGNSGTVTNGYGVYITGFGAGGTWTNTPYDLFAGDSAAYNYFAGNVGIGTTNPAAKLTVSGNASTLQAPPTNVIAHFANADGSNTKVLVDTYSNGSGSSVNPALTFREAEGTAVSPSATQANDILGAIAFMGYGASAYSGNVASIGVKATENFTNTANGTYMTFSTTAAGATSNTERVRIDNGGNVGIGTTSPNAKLDVNGTISGTALLLSGLPAYNTGFYLCIYNNGVNTGTTCSASDIRLKKDIHPIQNSLNKIFQLQGVSFYWKDKKSRGAGKNIGLIAQDVEKVFPELVTKGQDGYRSLQYDKLAAPLIEAVKELKADNDNLRAEDDRLRAANENEAAQIKTLTTRLDALEAAQH